MVLGNQTEVQLQERDIIRSGAEEECCIGRDLGAETEPLRKVCKLPQVRGELKVMEAQVQGAVKGTNTRFPSSI